MADVFSKTKRSEIMRSVKSSGNKSTELRLVNFFRDNNIHGWRRHYQVKGHPDFVFLNKRVAIFVDGCFWHGHNCRNIKPSDNKDYWDKKRQRNINHDKKITTQFQERGWQVIITAEKHRPSGLTGTGNPLEKIPTATFSPLDFLVCRSGHTGTAIRSG